ncbi:fatty-acyl-CoA synthase [Flexibacter flexilis DSM 6793]|uniref:Fatty-acyl-CoA synthase n=1 Tax=Flexibacter flexilis DSM 6793 TaxID=927664 RepID=A0A1I1HX34_9BACT|nr:acyl-CoA synthetase [Flexibacter flexilis]SFC28122.1 fatty-acyl-CoA synthase [Flexibacter flexilis DSM 6793]
MKTAKKSTMYDHDLDMNAANYTPLSPLSYIKRTAMVYPNYPAVIYGNIRRTWGETYKRCLKLASALTKIGIGHGDTVSIMAPNVPAIFEAHFGVPMTGAVLNTLNIRLDAPTLAFMLEHAEAKVLITDKEFSHVIKAALAGLEHHPIVIDIDDEDAEGQLLGKITYEQFLETGDEDFEWHLPASEWDAITLNYTSGTTGNPKGVVYHHRGAYLNASNNAMTWGMPSQSVYLWTLPMFHCNGWCFPWTMAAICGVSVFSRKVSAAAILGAIRDHGVTHFCGAPIVLGMIINAKPEERITLPHPVHAMTAGAPPPASVIEAIEKLNFKVTHVYGLTETYGPAVVCAWKEEWDELPIEQRAELKARQGVKYLFLEDLMVADPDTLEPVAADGKTMGEVFFRGNIVMKGYAKNALATEESFEGGWFHSGDLAVVYPDGYIQIKDRSKDIIISGGENISTIEVEGVLFRHEAVEEAAVVARPDEKWGETVCAFVKLREGHTATEAEIIAFCKGALAGFKVPRTVVFQELPKTATGKIQKYVLRKVAEAL